MLPGMLSHWVILEQANRWLAIFLVPFIQVVFGAEVAIRSLRASSFAPRGKWDVPILLGVVVLMEIGVWIPTHLDPEMDRCFASLAWFVEHFGRLSLILLSITGGLTILFAIVIFYRLTTLVSIPQCQRIAASQMVYYLVLSTVSMVCFVPRNSYPVANSSRLSFCRGS
jgi:hypothetical protein